MLAANESDPADGELATPSDRLGGRLVTAATLGRHPSSRRERA
jgi:hypothetical protein